MNEKDFGKLEQLVKKRAAAQFCVSALDKEIVEHVKAAQQNASDVAIPPRLPRDYALVVSNRSVEAKLTMITCDVPDKRIYGVRFTGDSPRGTRTFSAAGLTAAAGTDKERPRNDFDKIMPWAGLRRCNTTLKPIYEGGVRVPKYYAGEQRYNNTDDDVFVQVPLFFYATRVRIRNGVKMLETSISMYQHKRFRAPRKFCRPNGSLRPYVFLPAYTAGVDKNGAPVSRAGYEPHEASLNSWMKLLQSESMGDICIESTMDDEIRNVLFDVEFATLDSQSVMMGAVNLDWGDGIFAAGACDCVIASSGSPVSNTDGKHPCMYRGMENPWGNQWRWRWDVLVRDGIPHAIEDPDDYTGEVNGMYLPLSYQISDKDGWISELGFDPKFPHVQLPIAVEGMTDKHYACKFWGNSSGVRALLVGNHLHSGRNAGSRSFVVGIAPSCSHWSINSALSPA